MRKLSVVLMVLIAVMVISETAWARGRTGSQRVGGFNSHGKGSRYVGGY